MYVLLALLLLGVLITAHEAGHFLAARACGIEVEEFSMGMGPKLLQRRSGRGTLITLRLLPIGGYCAMEGEDEKSDDPRAFGNRPVWQRMIVVAAGGIMNILIAVLLMMVICGQEDRYATMRIAGFAENSAFEAAGV